MSRDRLERNLGLLRRRLEDYAEANKIATPHPPPNEAARLSESLYLAHSTSSAKFSEVCHSGRLISCAQLAAARGDALKPDSAEVLLGTADYVFFYVGPFRYPNTACGLLLCRSLEERSRLEGVATPFDSGGLVGKYSRADPAESPQEFLARHELPVPEHREYLLLSLGVLFETPADYVEGNEPHWAGPCGLAGGDQRRWTHEVRIPDQVPIRGGHLQAVFAPTGRVAGDPKIGGFFEWCQRERVDRVTFSTPRGDDFEALRGECIRYMRRRLQLQ